MSNQKPTYEELEKEVQELQARLSEQSKKENEENFKNLFETSQDGIAMTNMDGHIINCNKAFLNMLGYDSMEKIQNKSYEQITPIEYHQKEKKIIEEETFIKGYCDEYEKEYIKKDGSRIPVRLRAWLRKNHKNIPIGMWVMVRDITVQKQAEKKLKESEEKFKTIFENAPILINSFNTNGKCILWNKECEKTFGYTIEEVNQADDPLSLFYPDDEVRAELIKTIVSEPDITFHEWNPITRYGKTLSTLWANIRISDKMTIGVGHDITERKQAEESLLQNNNHLNKLNQIALKFTNLSPNAHLEELITKQVKEITHAKAAIFSEYNDVNKTLTPKYIEMESGLLKKVVNLIGTKIQNIQSVVSDKRYREMTTDLIGIKKTLYDTTFGAIPRKVSEAVEVLLKVDRFVGIAYLLDGKLYGTSILAMGIGQPDPPREILENFIHLASASLRRKQAEQALKESEEKFRTLYNNAPLSYQSLNKEGCFIDINPMWLKTLGYDRNEVIGKWFGDFLHPDYMDHFRKNFPAFKKRGWVSDVQFKMRKKDDTYIYVSFEGCIGYTPEGEFKQTYCVFKDITEQRKAEQALKESEEKFRRILENAEDMIYRISLPDGKYQFVSNAAAKIAGCPIEEIFNSPFIGHKLIHPDWKEYYESGLKDLLDGNLKPFYEYKIINRKGKEKWLYQRSNLIYGDDHKPIAIEGIVTDITDIKEAEQALKESESRLKILNADKDKFMSILAHDLRNPFNTLLGFSQLLSKNIRKYDMNKIEEQVNIINNTASNTYKLLEDILLWSRAQSGKIVYEPDDFNFYEACKSIMEKVNNRALLKGISVKCKVSNKLNVFSDINLVETVVRNLVSNAIKFTNKGGTITLDAKETENEIIVSVADTGVGIEKETLSEIFNVAEYKTTRGTDKEEGTGLGLQICKEFVEKMGGKIWVESEVSKGSVFYFTIPKQKNIE